MTSPAPAHSALAAPHRRLVARPAAGVGRWRRVWLTGAALLLWGVVVQTPLPGLIPHEVLELSDHIDFNRRAFSMGRLALTPLVSALLFAMVGSAALPSTWKLSGRARWARWLHWAWMLALPLTVVQAGTLTFMLERVTLPDGRFLIAHPAVLTRLAIWSSLAAGSFLTMWLAELITRHGVGNGYSLLLFADVVIRLPGQVTRMRQWLTAGEGPLEGGGLLALLSAGLLGALLWLGRKRFLRVLEPARQWGEPIVIASVRGDAAGVLPLLMSAQPVALLMLARSADPIDGTPLDLFLATGPGHHIGWWMLIRWPLILIITPGLALLSGLIFDLKRGGAPRLARTALKASLLTGLVYGALAAAPYLVAVRLDAPFAFGGLGLVLLSTVGHDLWVHWRGMLLLRSRPPADTHPVARLGLAEALSLADAFRFRHIPCWAVPADRERLHQQEPEWVDIHVADGNLARAWLVLEERLPGVERPLEPEEEPTDEQPLPTRG